MNLNNKRRLFECIITLIFATVLLSALNAFFLLRKTISLYLIVTRVEFNK